MQPAELLARERYSASPWPDSGAEERLVRIDVAHPAQQLLIEQSALDGCLTSAKELNEVLNLRLQRLVARRSKTSATLRLDTHDGEPAETPRIDEAQFAARSKLQH